MADNVRPDGDTLGQPADDEQHLDRVNAEAAPASPGVESDIASAEGRSPDTSTPPTASSASTPMTMRQLRPRRSHGRVVPPLQSPGVEENPSTILRKRPPFELQAEDIKARLQEEANILEEVLQAKADNDGVLPWDVRLQAATDLRCHHNTVGNKVKQIEEYLAVYPGRIVDALVPYPPGPDSGRDVTPDQRTVIRGELHKQRQVTVDDRGRRYEQKKRRFRLKKVFNLVNKPEFGNPVSTITLRRVVVDIINEDAFAFEYSRLGRKKASSEYAHKIWIDFGSPHEVYISDARALPILIRIDGSKEPTTVVLIVVIDAYSRYVLDWRLVPKKEFDVVGELKKVDFTQQDSLEMFAKSMRESKFRPYTIYIDNGSQYRILKRQVHLLLDRGDKPIEVVNSEPYRPNGRGVIESMLGVTDEYLEDFPGFFEEDTLEQRNAAKKDDLMTFQPFQEIFEDYFRHWNQDPHESGESRFEVFNHHSEALAAPSDLRLLFFARTVKQGKAKVHDDGIRYENNWYEPIRKDDEMFDMRANAAARRKLFKTDVPFIEALFGGQLYAYVSFDGQNFEPVKEKTKTSFRNKGHPKSQQQLMNRVARRPSQYIAEMERVILEKFGVELGVRASDKEYVPLAPAGVPASSTGDPQQTSGRQRSKAKRQTSTKSAAGTKQGQTRKGRGKNPAQQANGTALPRPNTGKVEPSFPASLPAQPLQSSDNTSEHLRRLEQHLFGEEDEEIL